MGATAVRTFLVADVRGYTRFTREHGDDAAARLTTRFAELAQQIVSGHGGEVVEVRGDEVLAVFDSARAAVRAALALAQRYAAEAEADPSLPLLVGIGLDAGEAVPVEDGYRGGALNLAARLCAAAGPGEILASGSVVHLAGTVDGAAYVPGGRLRLKGFGRVAAMRVEPAGGVTRAVSGGSVLRGRGARRWAVVVAAALAVAAVVAVPQWLSSRPSSGEAPGPGTGSGASPAPTSASAPPSREPPVAQVSAQLAPAPIWALPMAREQVPTPPGDGANCLSAERLSWVGRLGGVPGGSAQLSITVVSASDDVVVLRDVRVVPVRRPAPAERTMVALCPPEGGEAPVRALTVDLDAPRPRAIYHRPDGTAVAPFAFTIAPGEPETFLLEVAPPRRPSTIDWTVELHLVAGGRTHVAQVADDSGRPFRLAGTRPDAAALPLWKSG